MKTTMLCLIALALLALPALAAPDSLGCRMIDWLDAPGATLYSSGTWLWDMAMGDSFLVWCPGSKHMYVINPFSQGEVDTLFTFTPGTPWNITGASIKDSLLYTSEGRDIVRYRLFADSLDFRCFYHVPWASFHYAVIRDTFLYTTSPGTYGLHCINIANPESIFVVWNAPAFIGQNGMEVIDSFVYCATPNNEELGPGAWRPRWQLNMVKLIGDTAYVGILPTYMDNRSYGNIATDGEHLFYVNNDLGNIIEPDFPVPGDAHLGVWGEDYSYEWTEPDSEKVLGIEVLSDTLIAVGFEHGFSILNYENLDSMFEVAHYRDTDSVFAFTHFALKDSMLFAMAHPRSGICRMYMFKLDDHVLHSIDESPNPPTPDNFAISAHPNPFNSAVTITIDDVGAHGRAPSRVEIFDVNGRRIKTLRPSATSLGKGGTDSSTLTKGGYPEGTEGFIWQPGESIGSGVYLARINRNGSSQALRLVYLK